jgi:hypothetical protein
MECHWHFELNFLEVFPMMLSQVRFVEIYKKIDGYRMIKLNQKKVKVSYTKDTIVYDTQNEISLLWLLRKILHDNWIPYAKGTKFGINQPLEIDEHYRSGEFKNIYQVTDPLGYELSQDALRIHHRHCRDYQKKLESDIIEKAQNETAKKALMVCVARYKAGKSVPPTLLPDVLEYLRQQKDETIHNPDNTIE